MDKETLLDVPDMLRRLKDKYGADLPKWRDKVLDIEKQSQMMGDTLRELSEAYNVIAAAAEEMLPSPEPKKIIAKSLEDLGELKKEMAKVPRCKSCDSTHVRITGKNRDSLYCDDCGWAG